MLDSGLFRLDGSFSTNTGYYSVLFSNDNTIFNFRKEMDNLKIASKTLRPELYSQAIVDLLNKYDIPLKKEDRSNKIF